MRTPLLYALLFISALFTTIFTTSCGEENYQQAIDRCENLMTTLCEKSAATCAQSSYQDCETIFRQQMNCGAAIDTSNQYDRCIADIKNSSCPAFDMLPSSCANVIILGNP